MHSVVDPDPRIRIRMDPHHFGNLDPHPGPHPHYSKIAIRIHIKVISWIRNPIRINLQMTRQNVWNMSLFELFFRGFERLFGS